jgi:hypothetical protein
MVYGQVIAEVLRKTGDQPKPRRSSKLEAQHAQHQ